MTNVSFRTFFKVYGVTALLSVVLQTYLKIFAMDSATGFYSGASVLVVFLQLLLLVAVVFWFYATFRRKARHDYALDYRHLPTSILSIVTGLSIVAYTATDVINQVSNPLLTPFRQKLTILFSFALGIAAGVSMIVAGLQPTYGRYGKSGAILGVIPCVWQLVVLLGRFNFFIAITTLSDVLFQILFMCFATLFLLGQARIVYGLGIRNGRSYAFPSGMATSVFGLLLVVPNLMFFLFRGGVMPSVEMSFFESLYVLSLSVYAPVFLSGFAKSIHTV